MEASTIGDSSLLTGIESEFERVQTVLRNRQLPAGEYKTVRDHALQKVRELGAVSSSQELWRFTSPGLFSLEAALDSQPSRAKLGCVQQRGSQHQELPEGVSIQQVLDAGLLKEVLAARERELASDAWSWLQLACVSSAALVRVQRGRHIEAELKLSTLSAVAGRSQVPLVVIELEPGAQARIFDDLELDGAAGQESPLYAPIIEVFLRPNASLEYVSLENLPAHAGYCSRQRFHLMRDARLSTVHVALGARASRVDLDCRLCEPGASAEMCGLYLVQNGRHVDFHPSQIHLAPHCHSDLYYKGALKDRGRSVYYGYIRVAEAAQKTDAYQTNRTLLLSEDARADAIPNLEIKANDVKCSHGASVGQVGEEDLFYLMTRGISRAHAERLLIEGFFEDVQARIRDESLRAYVRAAVLGALGGAS